MKQAVRPVHRASSSTRPYGGGGYGSRSAGGGGAHQALGLPRPAVESARRHSLGPRLGYFRTGRRLVDLARPPILPGSGRGR
jgi:hypothetical protein